MRKPKKQKKPLNDLSRSLTPFDPNQTLITVVELSVLSCTIPQLPSDFVIPTRSSVPVVLEALKDQGPYGWRSAPILDRFCARRLNSIDVGRDEETAAPGRTRKL